MSQRRGLVLSLAIVAACEPTPGPAPAPGLVKEARLGVFYGGQVQEREQVPRAVDQTRQSQGFRVRFHEPLARAVNVRWEVEMPSNARGRSAPVSVSKLGELSLPPGREQFDQVLRFEPEDPVGLYNVRVLVDGELVIDRAWLVFDARARQRQKNRDAKSAN